MKSAHKHRSACAVAMLISATTLMAAPALAADKSQKLAERMKREIRFSSSASIPDELADAIQPYMSCGSAVSGTRSVVTREVVTPRPMVAGSCDAERQTASHAADAKLIALGVTDAGDRHAIIENSLLVAELNSAGNAEYMRRYIK